MKGWVFLRAALAVVLPPMAAGPGLASGSHPSWPAQAVDSGARPAAASEWVIETVDATLDVGSHVSIASNSAGRTYVSYYDAALGDLMVATYVGAGGNCGTDNRWLCGRPAYAGDVGQFTSIATAPVSRLPTIAFYNADTNAITSIRLSNGVWSSIVIAYVEGGHTSLKMAGDTHIAFYCGSCGPDRLMHAQSGFGGTGNCASTSWRCDEIDSGPGVGQYPSLALDGSGQPRIAYHHGATTGLRYAEKYGSNWTIREVLPVTSGYYASLAVDVNNGDLPHIAHYNASTGKLGYAVRVGSGGNCGLNSSSSTFEWQCDEIDDMGTLVHTRDVALALDLAGYPVIAYHRYLISGIHTVSTLDVARPIAATGLQFGDCGPSNTWHCETVQSTGHPGDYLAIDVWHGEIRIAYLGSSRFGGLKLARLPARRWFLPLVSKW